MSPTTAGVLVVLAAAVLALAVQHRSARRADVHERAHVFDDLVPRLADARLAGDGEHGYPVLTGRLDGRPVTARVVVDAVTLRKLPALWVEVVVHRPLAAGGTLNVLRRPTGTEFFSPDAGLPHELAPPPGVPRPVRVACADPDRAPSTAVLAPATALLGEPATKEVGVGRRGLRVVLLVAEGDQTSYRTARRAVFDRARVEADAVVRAVAVLEEIGDRVGDAITAPAGTGA
ncbi:MAG: hypothetical protein AVDCRST_MAG54-3871 [uncultured Actinomycetospora sp.]|uniref:Uncharacterized protein n=1 Tax=uncultured Actinomycetospora sp. TaxID=1135996 RepID=A0A6J4JPK3_9PSEU|nr:MAG: hypothetical protein AVDCRST_MAG54-3871 [uncultured Actinomycetospora sp.]